MASHDRSASNGSFGRKAAGLTGTTSAKPASAARRGRGRRSQGKAAGTVVRRAGSAAGNADEASGRRLAALWALAARHRGMGAALVAAAGLVVMGGLMARGVARNWGPPDPPRPGVALASHLPASIGQWQLIGGETLTTRGAGAVADAGDSVRGTYQAGGRRVQLRIALGTRASGRMEPQADAYQRGAEYSLKPTQVGTLTLDSGSAVPYRLYGVRRGEQNVPERTALGYYIVDRQWRADAPSIGGSLPDATGYVARVEVMSLAGGQSGEDATGEECVRAFAADSACIIRDAIDDAWNRRQPSAEDTVTQNAEERLKWRPE